MIPASRRILAFLLGLTLMWGVLGTWQVIR